MEDKYPGMWQRWFKNQCVAVGWSPDDGYRLNGDTSGGKGWSTARNAIKKMEVGDFVVVAMKNNKIARIGEIKDKAIEDSQWDPLVPKSKSVPRGKMGRRIFVRWDLTLGPQDLDLVIKLPEDNRFTSGELRPTVGEIRSQKIEELEKAVKLPANWVSLLGQFVYEKALSDYIANYPHHLKDGLTQYPDSKIREKVFKDSSRLDVLLIDIDETPVIVECKQDSPSRNDIEQLKNYMKNLFEETGKKPRGILVHGGSQILRKDVSEYLKKEPNIEVMSYKLDIEFRRSN
jgi:hypothetical protein